MITFSKLIQFMNSNMRIPHKCLPAKLHIPQFIIIYYITNKGMKSFRQSKSITQKTQLFAIRNVI